MEQNVRDQSHPAARPALNRVTVALQPRPLGDATCVWLHVEPHGRRSPAIVEMVKTVVLDASAREKVRRRFTSQAEARMACFSFIEGCCNPVRLHSGLGYRSQMTHEAEMQKVPDDA